MKEPIFGDDALDDALDDDSLPLPDSRLLIKPCIRPTNTHKSNGSTAQYTSTMIYTKSDYSVRSTCKTSVGV